MINMSSYAEWQHGVSNRNYHVLQELLLLESVQRVIAVDYPPLTWKRAARALKESWINGVPGATTVKGGMIEHLVKVNERLLLYSNVEYFFRPRKFVSRLRETLQPLKLDDVIVWSFFPPIMPWLADLGQKLTIFDAVDNWGDHASYERFRPLLKRSYDFIKKNADVIFTVSENLQALFDHQPNVFWVPNGVDIKHYHQPQTLINRDIADLPRPIIGYIGVVQERVDIELISFIARKHPTKSIVIVGPVWHSDDERTLRQLPNIHLLGYKSYEEAPSYIQQFDVGIIPHRQSDFSASTNPMKLYEYLACGKPVVATKGSGAEIFGDMVYIADNAEDFNRKLYLALEENSEARIQERRRAVEAYSWNAVVKQMLDIVEKKLKV